MCVGKLVLVHVGNKCLLEKRRKLDMHILSPFLIFVLIVSVSLQIIMYTLLFVAVFAS